MKTVAIIGALTAIFAASIGLVQNDIKRVLAYSTVSQLGYMFLALGVGAFAAGVFHVFTHAFFKALLFLGAGSVIHAMSGEQDMRNMGDLGRRIPITYWTMLDGHAGYRGNSALCRFRIERRNSLAKLVVGRRRLSSSLVCGLRHCPDDRLLYVPPDLFDLQQPSAHEPRRRTPHS